MPAFPFQHRALPVKRKMSELCHTQYNADYIGVAVYVTLGVGKGLNKGFLRTECDVTDGPDLSKESHQIGSSRQCFDDRFLCTAHRPRTLAFISRSVGFGVDVCRAHGDVSGPGTDSVDVNAGAKKVSSCGVPPMSPET
jgi:hypothetical protein